MKLRTIGKFPQKGGQIVFVVKMILTSPDQLKIAGYPAGKLSSIKDHTDQIVATECMQL